MTPRHVTLAAALCFAGASLGQEKARERIFFSALDRNSRPILGLGAEEFVFKVDGRPAPLEDFRAGRPLEDRSTPLVAWILLSAYRAISSRSIADQAAAAARIFDLLHPDSALGVQVISDRVETLLPLGHDPEGVRRAFT